jgi:hypothetical protein
LEFEWTFAQTFGRREVVGLRGQALAAGAFYQVIACLADAFVQD